MIPEEKNMGLQHRIKTTVKRSLRDTTPYLLARNLWEAVEKTLHQRYSINKKVISLKPKGPSQGDVLCSFLIEPFLLKADEFIPHSHTNYWECSQVVNTFLDFGYSVDVINYRNNTFIPHKEYSFFIDPRWNFDRLAPILNADCVKVMHIETADILFHNAAQSKRLLSLQQRKGVVLMPRKWIMPNHAIELADCATMMGNEFTLSTYKYANKPIYPLHLATSTLFPWNEEKDFEECRKRFLWFGSGGLVHKGLDLVLDAFAAMPEFHLTVCGPINREKDFERAYHKELYETPNIHTTGWVDTAGAEFRSIIDSHIGFLHPSCSEGQAGAVVVCLHAGLVPIISYESGVDVNGFGTILKTCSIEEIQRDVRAVADLPASELKRKARAAWEYAREQHTREKFAEEYRSFVAKLTANPHFYRGTKKRGTALTEPTVTTAAELPQ